MTKFFYAGKILIAEDSPTHAAQIKYLNQEYLLTIKNPANLQAFHGIFFTSRSKAPNSPSHTHFLPKARCRGRGSTDHR